MRCGAAKRIFNAGSELDALRIILDPSVDEEIRRQAARRLGSDPQR